VIKKGERIMKYAVIDISSISVSLLVAEGDKDFNVTLRKRINVSILNYAKNDKLSKEGLHKLLKALEEMKEIVKEKKVDRCYVISTASVRTFRNSDKVEAKIKEKMGITIDVLDGNSEAQADYLSNVRYESFEKALLIDLGGGSIELADFSAPQAHGSTFLGFGAATLNKRFVKDILPTEEEADAIKKYVKKQLKHLAFKPEGTFATAILVGATCQALYQVYRDYFNVKGNEADKRMDPEKYKKLAKKLVKSPDRNMMILKDAPEKINTLVTSAIILKTILKYFGITNIFISDFGVKEGYLSQIIAGTRKALPMNLNYVAPKKEKKDKKKDDKKAEPKQVTAPAKKTAKPSVPAKPVAKPQAEKVKAPVSETKLPAAADAKAPVVSK
jgi:exopolyphosphatase/guanosine-5'-triphosphate,3'-diphosphate pyrophosphatase